MLPTHMEVNALGYTMGGVLMQQVKGRAWHLIAYQSESMAEVECTYEVYDKEILVVIQALEDWWHYLKGLPNPFTIVTNHCNLEYWQTAQDLSHWQARWSLYLSHFDFKLTHRPGTTNAWANSLSCLFTYQKVDSDNNQGQIVLKPKQFAKIGVLLARDTDALKWEIHKATERDSEVTLALEVLREQGS
jgi:reverse transcriptase-like protein